MPEESFAPPPADVAGRPPTGAAEPPPGADSLSPGDPSGLAGSDSAASPPADVEVSADVEIPVGVEEDTGKFLVRLDNFTGPFDLLLQLIGKHKLDVTEVALHVVTDDFIAYIRAMGDDWDLDEASEFLLVAATLLDLKAARLLPAAEVEDEEDLALLEARDLLFARLLQYKAYKEAAAYLADLEGSGAKRWPRAVSMEKRYAEALPDLVLGVGVERLFKLALKQFIPKPGPPEVSIAHIHQVRVSVREHATLLTERLRRAGSATFSLLVADCENTLEIVARFLALLELYREGLIDFEQPLSLDELTVRWIGGDVDDVAFDIDDYEGSPAEPEKPAGDPAAAGDADLDVDDDDVVLDAGVDDAAADLDVDDDDAGLVAGMGGVGAGLDVGVDGDADLVAGVGDDGAGLDEGVDDDAGLVAGVGGVGAGLDVGVDGDADLVAGVGDDGADRDAGVGDDGADRDAVAGDDDAGLDAVAGGGAGPDAVAGDDAELDAVAGGDVELDASGGRLSDLGEDDDYADGSAVEERS